MARGGGSLEDLNAFNSELVARAIFNSKIPIISAIGHETDYTIADFTADLRAPTPTAAAEMAVPQKADLQYHLQDHRQTLLRAMGHQIQSLRQTIDHIHRHLKHPQRHLEQMRSRLDDLTGRIQRLAQGRVDQANDQVANLKSQLTQLTPHKRALNLKLKHQIIINKLLDYIEKRYFQSRHQADSLTTALKAYNPMDVLKRGYSITRTIDVPANLVTDAKSVAPNQILEILLAKGQLTVEVKDNR